MLGISWLGSMMNESGHAGVGCVVCSWALKHGTSLSSYKASDSRKFATYQITALLLRHENNPCHIANVSAIFQAKCGPGLSDLSKVPTEQQFTKVWNTISKGAAPSADIAGVGSGSRKVPQICWCLAEGLWEMDRAFMENGLLSLGICRDESKHRIDVRFSATVKAKGKIVTRRGFMGRAAALHGSAATDILDDTQRIFKSFATSSEEPPRLPKNKHAGALLHFNQDLHHQLRDKLHHLAVDSASNELLSGKMLQKGRLLDTQDTFGPNLMDITRDKTHGVRRTARNTNIPTHIHRYSH